MKIMLDVDGILYDAKPLFYREARALGIDWPVAPKFWGSRKQMGVDSKTWGKLFSRVHCEECVSALDPYPFAVSVLQTLVNDYPFLEPWYVSNRNPEFHGVLQDWLEANEFPYAHNVYVSHNKLVWIDDQRPEIVVDDRVRTMIAARFEYGARVFSIIHPWNINLVNNEIEGIVLKNDWDELGEEIEKTILAHAEVASGK